MKTDYVKARYRAMTLQQIGKLLIAATLLLASAAWAGLTATVDRNIISDLDLMTLTVRASDDTADAAIDFSSLRQDFEIITESSRQNSSMSIINGRRTSVVYKDHVLTLSPKRMGNLFIPSFRAGSERSQPITIRVQQQTASQRQRMNQFVFFETLVDTNDAYVQGQIIYSVKLFHTEGIGGDFPPPPSLPDTVVETLENEMRYESVVDGQRYYVLEKRYALFPQRSGPLEIPRERFVGTRGRGGFFSQQQRVNATSESHTIKVKTIPSSFSGANWLPAKALGVKEAWTETNPVFRVGEPVNRQLAISAIGLSDAVLPRLGKMKVTNAKVYADPPATENRVSQDGLTALQITTVGIVPIKEGNLVLPETRIHWWNTQTDREEIAIIPSETYQVLPALSETSNTPTVTVPLSELSQPTPISGPAKPYWQWAAITLGFLWLLSTWQWLRLRLQLRTLESAKINRQETPVFSNPDESHEFSELKKACTRNRAADTHRHLFMWGKARFPEIHSVLGLGKLDTRLAEQIILLETHLYGEGDKDSWRGNDILKMATELRKRKVKKHKDSALETELNPG
jgi:hypothetical protein